jgi:hypothetical protein
MTRAEAEQAWRELRDAIAADLTKPPLPKGTGAAALDLLGPLPAKEWRRRARLLFFSQASELGGTAARLAAGAVVPLHPGSGRRRSALEHANSIVRTALKLPGVGGLRHGIPGRTPAAQVTQAMWETDQEIRALAGVSKLSQREFAGRLAEATGVRFETVRKRLSR